MDLLPVESSGFDRKWEGSALPNDVKIHLGD
jgi:hypothetical protein